MQLTTLLPRPPNDFSLIAWIFSAGDPVIRIFKDGMFRQEMDTEAIMGKLVKIRGIGRWTAELTILRGFPRSDAFPPDDVGVRRFISRFYFSGRKISAAEARVFAGRWGAWKGFAAYYLEVADLLGIHPLV